MGQELDATEVDFEIVREGWNRYQLPEGIILRVRSPIVKIFKAKPKDKPEGETYLTAGSNVFDVFCPKEVKGAPSADTRITAEDIIEDDVEFTVISENWSEYLILPEKTILKAKPVIVKVSKSRKFNQFGDPIFNVQSNVAVKVSKS